MKLRPFLSLAVSWILICCQSGDRIAGTSHETETGNQISGILRSEDDISDSGILVYARSAAYVQSDSMSAGTRSTGQWADSARTDASGSFHLALTQMDTGAAFLEAMRDTSLGIRIALDGGRTKPRDLGIRYLGRTGNLRGEIGLPLAESGSVLIQLLGTSRFLVLDSGSATFLFSNLPEGAYTCRVTGLRPKREPVEFHAEVLSGGTVLIPDLTLEKSSGAVRGQVRMPPGTHGIAEVEAVGTGFQTSTDSLGRYYLSGLKEGQYTLRAFGLVPSRDTVEAPVSISNGFVTDRVDFQLHQLSVLLVDGVNNHDWVFLTKAFRSILEATNLFHITVATTPPSGSDSTVWAGWKPDFTAFDAVFLNFSDIKDPHGASWPAPAKEGLQSFVANGGGLVVAQTAQSAFTGWDAYREMLGLAWGKSDVYPGVYLDSSHGLKSIPVGQESSYTVRGALQIHRSDVEHPITRGVPAVWMHADDAVDLGLRGPQKNMTVLSFLSSPVSGRLEPVEWTVAYGKGRVYNTSLGDVVKAGPDTSVRCAGFQTMLARGAQWAASGLVTLPLPLDFPTDTSASIRETLPTR